MYVTVEQVRAQLADGGERIDADLIQQAIDAASAEIDDWCGRSFEAATTSATTRLFRPGASVVADVDNIGTTTDLLVEVWQDGAWTALDADSFLLEPLGADSRPVFAWNQIRRLDGTWPADGDRPTLRITARWGWSQTPPQVEQAALLRSVSLYKRKDAPWGVAGFGDMGAVRIRHDLDVLSLLGPLRGPLVA